MKDRILLWLWLNEVFGEANPRKWEATSRFDTIDECFEAYSHGDFYGLNYEEAIRAQKADLEKSKRILEYCQKNNIHIYCYESEGFPQRLREIYNPPSVLFAKHNFENLDFLDDCVSVAVVGARNVDKYYQKVTEEITAQLAESGVIINSGFAVGVDSIAHKTALEHNGKTVAVLGCGIDYDYPANSWELKKKISEKGVVLSEYPPKTAPKPNYFKARNRLLSGLSLGVLVTQASTTSGSLNTVSNAMSQGKDIFCVPPKDIFDVKFAGVIDVLRDGAIPVFDARDIIYEYYETYSHKINYHKNTQNYTLKTVDSSIFSEKKTAPKPKKKIAKTEKAEEIVVSEKQPDVSVSTSDLTEIQRKIVEALKDKKLLADELSRETHIDIMELFGELTELEMLGVIKSLPGKRYSL